MASTRPNAILISGKATRRERKAASGTTIKPGQILEVSSAEFQEHSNAGGPMVPLVADLNPAHDIADGAAIDADYAVGETVTALEPHVGAVVQARLVGSATITEGETYLQSNTLGLLAPVILYDASIEENAVKFIAAESKTTGGSDELALVRRI